MSYLTELVLSKVRSFPTPAEAAAFFEVSEALVAQWEKGSKPVSLSAVEKVFDPEKLPSFLEGQSRQFEGRSVAFLLPSYKASNPRTNFALMTMLDRAKHAAMLDFGDAFIIHSRNKLADRFLKSKLEWSLWVDDDMIIPFGNAVLYNQFCRTNVSDRFAGFNSVDRLLSHGKTLVGGLYFGRWEHGKAVYAEGAEDRAEGEYARRAPHNVCKPTRWVGTGCLMVHRTVYLDIEKTFPHLARNDSGDFGHWFSPNEHDLISATEKALAILNDDSASETSRVQEAKKFILHGRSMSRHHSGLGMGEDVTFCVRATQSGHTPHIDLGLVCGHVGDYTYHPSKKII